MAVLQLKEITEHKYWWVLLYGLAIFLFLPSLQLALLLIALSILLSLHRLISNNIPWEIESNTITALYVSYNFGWLAGFIIGNILIIFSLFIGKRYSYMNLIKFAALAFVCIIAGKIKANLILLLTLLVIIYNLILAISYNFLGLNIIKNISFQASSTLVNILVIYVFFS